MKFISNKIFRTIVNIPSSSTLTKHLILNGFAKQGNETNYAKNYPRSPILWYLSSFKEIQVHIKTHQEKTQKKVTNCDCRQEISLQIPPCL